MSPLSRFVPCLDDDGDDDKIDGILTFLINSV